MATKRQTSLSDPVRNSPMQNATAASYKDKGTFKTAMNIVKNRGVSGLYSGFNLHLRETTLQSKIAATN